MTERKSIQGWRIGIADVLFVVFTLTIMQHATQGMMDDPGLGWHLRIPDLMVEQGHFVYEEHFCRPTEGNPWVTRAWLSDFLMRLAYGWGGLNAVALMTCMTVALTMRLIYRRLVQDGIHWVLAVSATWLTVVALAPIFVARPNVVAILGLWLVVDRLRQFHAGKISGRQLIGLVPVMLLWANMHGSVMAGLVLIGVAGAVEASLAVGSWNPNVRLAARQRLGWTVALGLASGLATLCNPNGIGLHWYNLRAVVDPFIQNNTTTEWLPPDFGEKGYFRIERLILILPLLAGACRRRINWMGLVLTVVWLHFALTCRRYSPLWAVIALPTLCELIVKNRWCIRTARALRGQMSKEIQELGSIPSVPSRTCRVSWLAGGILLFLTAFVPPIAAHNPQHMPSASLDRFLQIYDGGATFHSANWGGYLTWKGWDRPHHFRTWIDDRIEVHGREHTEEYYQIMAAADGWDTKLAQHQIQYVCVPRNAQLAKAISKNAEWQLCFEDDYAVVYRRSSAIARD